MTLTDGIMAVLLLVLIFVIAYTFLNTKDRDVTIMLEAMQRLVEESESCKKQYEKLKEENIRLKALLKLNGINFQFEQLTQDKRTQLRSAMHRVLTLSDLRTLAFDLDFDYESLQNGTTGNLVISIIQEAERKNKIPELVQWMEEYFPEWRL